MYNVVDLFAGAGGLSLGFEMTGKFQVVAVVENNKYAKETYIHNNPKVQAYEDIRILDFKCILDRNSKVDLVIGGPPCQGFSNANRQKRKIINGNNELVKKYVEAIKVLEPSIFVMENVKSIESSKHAFYLSYKERHYIVDELKVQTQNKQIIIYDRVTHLEEIMEFILENDTKKYVLEEEMLYQIRALIKKGYEIEKYLSKRANCEGIYQIIQFLQHHHNEDNWYMTVVNEIKNELNTVLCTKNITDKSIRLLEEFFDVQKMMASIEELKKHNAIYKIQQNHNQIVAEIETYIVIDYIKAAFNYLGYKIEGKVLNAAEYGVPQKRERYILIGIKKEALQNKTIEMPEPIISNENKYNTVKDAIKDLEDFNPSIKSMGDKIRRNVVPSVNSYYSEVILDSDIIYNHVCTDTRAKSKERFKRIEQGKNFHSLPDSMKDTYSDPTRTQNTIYKRLGYEQPADTVVNVRKSMWIHPIKNRAISAREAARLQSFPDSYKFIGTKDAVYQQIGNAVPPLLGRAVAESVLKLLDDEPNMYLKEIYEKYNK